MDSANIKLNSARAFVRSLNILLKYARLYGFDHKRTVGQFDTAWDELHEAIPVTNESGLLLGASGAQLLLDGVPVEATPAERSFAQLLSAAGLASIQFTSRIAKEDFERLVRAFPTQNTKPSALSERLKAALANVSTIRINEIRFVPEDASRSDALAAGLLTAQSLGADANSVKDWLRDPQKLLQLIVAAQGSRAEPGDGPGGAGPGTGETASGDSGAVGDTSTGAVSGNAPGTSSGSIGVVTTRGQSAYSGAAPASGSRFSGWSNKDEDILGILKLLTHLGHTVSTEGGTPQPGPLHEELTKLPAQSQEMLRQALAAVAAQTPVTNSKDPILLRLAEHLAIKFALERYERGEVKVDAVRNMFEKMSQEIEGLRKILGLHEQKLAEAGVIVESTAELLDRQFWAAVPERGKRSVLTSPDAWCIPARNIKQYVEELLQRGDEKAALSILQNYASCIQSPEFEARRRAAIGLADLGDVYASLGGRPLAPAIQVVGVQLSAERDDNLQGLISAAFVRLAQEAGACRVFPALLQALDSLDAVEHQRPVFAQNLRPRIGLEKRVPEFLEDVLRGERALEGMETLLQRVPRSTAENLILRFNRTSSRTEMQRLVDLARGVGDELMSCLRDALRSGSATDAAETAGLLSRLDPSVIERWLPERLADWPRQAQDRAVRLLAMGGAPERGSLLVKLLSLVDAILLPLAIDEIGLSENAGCIPALSRLAEGVATRFTGPFVRLKAVEALGRMKAQDSVNLLRDIAEGRHMFHWTHPVELRLAAVQSLTKINSNLAREVVTRSGFSANDLSMAPLDPLPNAKYFRRRRYPRVRLPQPIPAIATAGQDSYRLEVRGLSLSGGIASGEKHLPPGTLVSMRIGAGLRPIRAQVLMRDARAQGLGFEFAEMDLEERARFRKLLLENMPSLNSDQPALLTQSVS
jgi:PilZ domain-containing protein